MMDEDSLLAEFTDGHLRMVEPVTEELTLGSSWLFCTPEGDTTWHRVVKVERVRGRADGAQLRVTLEYP